MPFLVLALVFACSSVRTASAQQPPATTVGSEITYDDFIKSAPVVRAEQFRRLSAENKALITRTHAGRWLTANHARLSAAQIAVANEAIGFVTPQIYLQPNDPEILKQEQRIKQKLTCILGDDNARQAFVVDAPRLRSEGSTWQSVFDDWLSWFSVCVAR